VPLSRNLGTLTSWNHLGLSRPVTGLIYLLPVNSLRVTETPGTFNFASNIRLHIITRHAFYCRHKHICVRIRLVCLFEAGVTENLYKVKVKFSLEQATKARRGSRGIALLFL